MPTIARCSGSFLTPDGRIKDFPAQEKKLEVVLRYVLKSFEPGVRYTEKQVNEILMRFNIDYAFLRRSLIEYRMLAREGGGSAYWLPEGRLPELGVKACFNKPLQDHANPFTQIRLYWGHSETLVFREGCALLCGVVKT